jgi:anthranilate synthase component 2
MVLLVDNYDSFTYNLVDYLIQLGSGIRVFRNDDPIEKITQEQYTGIVLSPGPGKPEDSGHLLKLIRYYENLLPILGICLGHQALGTYFGAGLGKAIRPMHGKFSEIEVKNDYLFKDIPSSFRVVRYHSLVLTGLNGMIEPIARSAEGEIMAIRHINRNIRGLQFHPEAVLTDFGFQILGNWVSHNQNF